MSIASHDTAMAATISLEATAARAWDVVVAGAGRPGRWSHGGSRPTAWPYCWLIRRPFPGEGMRIVPQRRRLGSVGRRGTGRSSAAAGGIVAATMQLRVGRHEANSHCRTAYRSRAVYLMRRWCVLPSAGGRSCRAPRDPDPCVDGGREVRLRVPHKNSRSRVGSPLRPMGLPVAFSGKCPAWGQSWRAAPAGRGRGAWGEQRLLRAGHDLRGVLP